MVVYHFIAFSIQSSFIVIRSEFLASFIISSLDFHCLISFLKLSFNVIISYIQILHLYQELLQCSHQFHVNNFIFS